MRIRLGFFAAIASMAFGFPVSAHAQFQAPTSEELQMTSEPKAPGSDAVYLYREETVDDNLHFHTFYARIKVLTERGKELATVTVPYPKGAFSVTDVKGRTIHSDGTILPLNVKPSDLVEHKGADFQINKMVFTLPSAEVGSILEYRWQLRYDDNQLSTPNWQIQQPFFVRKAHYSFVPFKYLDRVTNEKGEAANKLLFSTMLPKDVQVQHDTVGRYFLDVTNVDAIPDEEFMPPMRAYQERVEFYYSPYYGKDDYWKSAGNHWSKEMNHFAEESGALKEAVTGIVAAGDSDEVKARKVYDAVMKLDNTDYTRRKTSAELKQLGLKQARQAEDVWKQKSGSSDEIALLYLAMARIAGLKAYAMYVCDRNRELLNPYFLSMGQFDDVLVILNLNGKDVTVDPGSKWASFGEIAWNHAMAGFLRQSDKGWDMGVSGSISYKEASTLRTADVTIGPDGSVKGTIRITMKGPAALRWRQVAERNDEDEVKKQFNEYVRRIVPDGVNADFDHFLGLEDFHSQLMGIVNISGNMGTMTGKRVFLPGAFFESRNKYPFVAKQNRVAPIDIRHPDLVQDQVEYHLPETFSVESSPTETQVPWKGHALMSLKSSVNKNDVTVTRSFARAFTVLDPKDYPDLHDFYQKVASADQQQLVLMVTPASKVGQ